MTLQLVGLGLLLGLLLEAAARNVLDQALRSKLRQAEERRRLDEEWSAVRAAHQQRGKCPHCTIPLSKRDSYSTLKIVEEELDDN